MESYKMWIGGKWVDADSKKTYAIINPATEEEFARVPLAGESDVNKAVEAAVQAFPIWSNKTQAERSKTVKEIALAMKAIIPELVRLDVLEHGTPEKISTQITTFASELCDFAASASRTLMGYHIPAYPNTISYLKREPVGVCGIITPWNVPLMMVVAKMAPALAVGNTCVIKAAEHQSSGCAQVYGSARQDESACRGGQLDYRSGVEYWKYDFITSGCGSYRDDGEQ